MARRRGPREGSIYRRKDGRWVGSIHIGYAEGKRIRKAYYGRTRSEVQKCVAQAVHDQQSGRAVLRDDRITVECFLRRWLTGVQPSLRAATYIGYSQLLQTHVIPTLGHVRLTKLSPHQVQVLLNDKVAAGLSPRTVGHIRAVLRRALNQAVRWDLLPRNVATLVDPPHVPRFELQPLDATEGRRLLAATSEDRLAALFVMALTTGMRQGELLGLAWADIDLEKRTVSVRHALSRAGGEPKLVEPKSTQSRRTLPLPVMAATALRRRKSAQAEERLKAGDSWQGHDLVFTSALGAPLAGASVTHRFQRLLADAGLRRQRFHDLRHACASLMLTQGVPARVVMETLGHSQISLTLNTYSHVVPQLQRDAADRVEALLA